MEMEGCIGAGGARVGLLVEMLGGDLDLRRSSAELWENGNGAMEMVVRCRGLAEDPCRRWAVEVLEAGDAAWEASDSTSSREWLCQPWFTLTMA